jgi:aminoglycoside/choline kinase family phosphotransferase
LNEEFDIPSPSFSLVQTYDNTRIPVAHIDLYRLNSSTESEELGIAELLPNHVVIVEWPDRLPDLDGPKLSLHFTGSGNHRHVKLVATGSWKESLLRNESIEEFLKSTKWENKSRYYFEGDASSRRYETISLKGKLSILMDMPQKPDGDAIKNGKSYSAIAHLAEGISSVLNVNHQLLAAGYSAPKIEISDKGNGLAIIENLGDQVFGKMMRSGADMHEAMHAAVAVLADMTTKDWPSTIPAYDVEAQLIETDLLVSWFWPFLHGTQPHQALHDSFEKIWRQILPITKPDKPHWVLRDFHSPNIIWIPERKGLQRIGLIDTQDAVIGHPAYDLVSLLQDARVDMDFAWAGELYKHYENLRASQSDFDKDKFSAAYAVLGAQRATKILGIFARLSKRDGKPAYLKHMPRVSRYLKRNLEHPSLVPLKMWYEKNMPEALDTKQP